MSKTNNKTKLWLFGFINDRQKEWARKLVYANLPQNVPNKLNIFANWSKSRERLNGIQIHTIREEPMICYLDLLNQMVVEYTDKSGITQKPIKQLKSKDLYVFANVKKDFAKYKEYTEKAKFIVETYFITPVLNNEHHTEEDLTYMVLAEIDDMENSEEELEKFYQRALNRRKDFYYKQSMLDEEKIYSMHKRGATEEEINRQLNQQITNHFIAMAKQKREEPVND